VGEWKQPFKLTNCSLSDSVINTTVSQKKVGRSTCSNYCLKVKFSLCLSTTPFRRVGNLEVYYALQTLHDTGWSVTGCAPSFFICEMSGHIPTDKRLCGSQEQACVQVKHIVVSSSLSCLMFIPSPSRDVIHVGTVCLEYSHLLYTVCARNTWNFLLSIVVVHGRS
jgi:hypothetical protein